MSTSRTPLKLNISHDIKWDDPEIIAVRERKRSLNPKKIEALADAIKQEGLLQPLHCRVIDRLEENREAINGTIVLVAGCHRLEAALLQGRPQPLGVRFVHLAADGPNVVGIHKGKRTVRWRRERDSNSRPQFLRVSA